MSIDKETPIKTVLLDGEQIPVAGGEDPVLQDVEITPTESEQIITAEEGYDGIGTATVKAIYDKYVGSGVHRRTSSDVTYSDATGIGVLKVPVGYYADEVTKTLKAGKINLLSVSKSNVSNNSVTLFPQIQLTTGLVTNPEPERRETVRVTAAELVDGSETATENGTYDVTNLAQFVVDVSGSGGLPTGIAAFDYGDVVISKAFTTTSKTFPHNLGVVPDLMIVFAPQNVAQSYSMLCAIRGSVFGWRSSAYDLHYAYHGSNTSTAVSWTNSNGETYGVFNMTENTFDLASHSTNYYWRAGTYKYLAIKFS